MWTLDLNKKISQRQEYENIIRDTLFLYFISEDWIKNEYFPDYKIHHVDDLRGLKQVTLEQINSLSHSNESNTSQIQYAINILKIDLILFTAASKHSELVCSNTTPKERN